MHSFFFLYTAIIAFSLCFSLQLSVLVLSIMFKNEFIINDSSEKPLMDLWSFLQTLPEVLLMCCCAVTLLYSGKKGRELGVYYAFVIGLITKT